MDLETWDDLIEQCSGSIFLRPECMSMHDYGYLPSFFQFYDDSQNIIGIAFGVLIKSPRRFVGRFIKSLYFPTLPVTTDGFHHFLDRMIQEIIRYGRDEKVISITIDSFYCKAAYKDFERLGFKTRGRWEFILDLQDTEVEIWDNMSKHHRRDIRYSGKKGLVFVENPSGVELSQLIELQESARERTRKKGGNYGLPSLQTYQSLKRNLVDKGYASLFLACKEGEPTSFLLVAIYNKRAYTIFAGTSPNGFHLLAPVFLYWNTALALKKMGVVEWNLGGIPWEAQVETSQSHGLFKFKERFGTKKVLCYSAEIKNVNKLRAATINFAMVLRAWNR